MKEASGSRRPASGAAFRGGSERGIRDSQLSRDRFRLRVLQLVSRIPPGRVATYGDLAERAGRPRAARAVGRIMAAGDRPGLPYHRVVAASGKVGGYGGSQALKAALLAAEGLIIKRDCIADFATRRWRA